jgi:hypothetical protein
VKPAASQVGKIRGNFRNTPAFNLHSQQLKELQMSMIDPKGTNPSALKDGGNHIDHVSRFPKKPKSISAETKQKQDAAMRFLRENGTHS